MILSIIILNWNSRSFLERCLGSIYENTRLQDKEIIVVDNGSTDGSVDFIRHTYPEIHLIENSRNRGVAPARNQGIKVAQGRYLLILDVDTVVLPNAIDVLIETMDKHSDVGLSGPQLTDPEGKVQYSCRRFPTMLSKIYRQLPGWLGHRLLWREELRGWDHSSPRYVGYVIGACQLLRREAMEDVGLYDERMFYGAEEIDYCLRLWKGGWKVLYVPQARVIHYEQRVGRRPYLLNRFFWEHFKNLLIFFHKHHYWLRRPEPEIEYILEYGCEGALRKPEDTTNADLGLVADWGDCAEDQSGIDRDGNHR